MASVAERSQANISLSRLSDDLERIAEIIGPARPIGISWSSYNDPQVRVHLDYGDFTSLFAGRPVIKEPGQTHEHLFFELLGIQFVACRRVAANTQAIKCPCPEPEGA